MRFWNRGSWFHLFSIVSMILGFIVDLAAFIQLVGLNIIVTPNANATHSHISEVAIRLPMNSEIVTFFIWLYTAVALCIFSVMTLKDFGESFWSSDWFSDWSPGRSPDRWPWVFHWLLPFPFFGLILPLLVVWFWVFGYIPVRLYVFLVPVAWFGGITAYGILLILCRKAMHGITIYLLAIGPAVLWLHSGYDWALPWILAITVFALLVGGIVGFVLMLLLIPLSILVVLVEKLL